MNESSGFASLTPSLLARKGQARPAMRPQAAILPAQGSASQVALDDLGWNDMGDDRPAAWSSIGKTASSLGMTPMPTAQIPSVVQQQADLSARLGLNDGEIDDGLVDGPVHVPSSIVERHAAELATAPTVPAVNPAAAPIVRDVSRPAATIAATQRKAAFTLRLDPERHLHLRLVCAVSHRSAQQIVLQALDAFLADQPSSAALCGRSDVAQSQ